MRRLFFIFLFLTSLKMEGQTITTIVGNGTSGYSGDGGAATAAKISWPFAIAINSLGTIYFTETLGNRIRKVTIAGIISTVAGTGSGGFNGDNIDATSAQLNQPYGIAVDANDNLYIADTYNNRVRKIDFLTGKISTIAGTGLAGFSGDNNLAVSGVLNNPYDVCFDNIGNLYIADAANYRIRKINNSGIISTIVGNGVAAYSGDGGAATSATIKSVLGLCTDVNGNLYFADRTDSRVRKVALSGIINTIAGTGAYFAGGDEGPAINAQLNPERLVCDKNGNIFIADGYKANIRIIDAFGIIHALTKDTIPGYYGDGGQAELAKFQYPSGITLDTCGNLYIADDLNARIRKITYPHCHYLSVENEKTLSSTLSIYPNPATDVLHIDNLQSKATCRVLSMVGTVQQLCILKAGNNSIDISALPTGMYMVEVVTGDGKKSVSKVVKQ